jgi:tRNA C32,U32 (ribose-2'-O)-methylase TrmJ
MMARKQSDLTTKEHESEIVEGIKRALTDMRLGRTIPHKKAMQRLRATVARASLKSKGGL